MRGNRLASYRVKLDNRQHMEPYVIFNQHPLHLRTIGVQSSSVTALAMFELPEKDECIRFTYYGAQVDMNVKRLDQLLSITITSSIDEKRRTKGGYTSIWVGGDYSRGPTRCWTGRESKNLCWYGNVPSSEKIGLFIIF